MNPGSFFSNSLFVHSFVCAITHLFLNEFQPNFYQHFSLHVILFLAYKKHSNLFVIGYYTAG